MTDTQPTRNRDTTEHSPPSGLDALEALLLLTGHLTDVLPLLAAANGIPATDVARVGLIEGMAKRIVADPELVRDFYQALGLLAGRDISAMSVAELLVLSKDLLEGPALGDVWRAAYAIGLISEDLVAQWVLYDSLAGG